MIGTRSHHMFPCLHHSQMAIQYADLAAKSPIFGPIGNLHGGGDSLVSVARAASNQAQSFTESYKERVVDYCVEWEAIVSTRIDDELKETKQLNKRLNHYQSKVAGLRTKVNHYNGTSTEAPSNLSTKLARNEVKLESAWKVHEQAASRLCNLIDEVTLQGWMDLYPLVVASMKWEVERASAELEAISKLQSVTNDLEKEFEKNSISVELTSRVPIAVETNNVSESETAASLNREEEDDDSSSQGSEGVVTAEDNVDGAPTLKRSDSLTIISATPLSPNEVAQKGGGWWPLH